MGSRVNRSSNPIINPFGPIQYGTLVVKFMPNDFQCLTEAKDRRLCFQDLICATFRRT
jgi:hypothetical protein